MDPRHWVWHVVAVSVVGQENHIRELTNAIIAVGEPLRSSVWAKEKVRVERRIITAGESLLAEISPWA